MKAAQRPSPTCTCPPATRGWGPEPGRHSESQGEALRGSGGRGRAGEEAGPGARRGQWAAGRHGEGGEGGGTGRGLRRGGACGGAGRRKPGRAGSRAQESPARRGQDWPTGGPPHPARAPARRMDPGRAGRTRADARGGDGGPAGGRARPPAGFQATGTPGPTRPRRGSPGARSSPRPERRPARPGRPRGRRTRGAGTPARPPNSCWPGDASGDGPSGTRGRRERGVRRGSGHAAPVSQRSPPAPRAGNG